MKTLILILLAIPSVLTSVGIYSGSGPITGTDKNGNFRRGTINAYGELSVHLDRYGRDAFGRLRVSDPYTIGANAFTVEPQNFLWDTALDAGGNTLYAEESSSLKLSVSATSGSYAIQQTKTRFHYQSGKSQLLKITFDNFHSETGVTKRVGLMLDYQSTTITATAPYIPANGVYFESTPTGVYSVVMGNGFEYSRIEQADWLDPLDGTGKSGITIDFSKSQLAVIDFEWLGVGTVRHGFQLDHNEIIYISKYTHANLNTGVYMKSANLPIRYEIRSDGSGAGYLTAICSEVESEGGQEELGKPSIAALDTDETIAFGPGSNNRRQLILALKFKDGHNGIEANIDKISTILESSGLYKWELILNPTIAGTVTYVDLTGTAFQIAKGITDNIVTDPEICVGCRVLDFDFASSDQPGRAAITNTSIKMGTFIDGTSDVIGLVMMPFSAAETGGGGLVIRQVP